MGAIQTSGLAQEPSPQLFPKGQGGHFRRARFGGDTLLPLSHWESVWVRLGIIWLLIMGRLHEFQNW